MALLAVLMSALFSCSPKIVYQKETVTEYRDRVVHDTATVEIPVIKEVNVTPDDSSHLENTYAKSDALIRGGLLKHTLETKPQKIKAPVEVHVTDTLVVEKEAQTIYKEVKVEKELTWWQKFRMGSFWWLVALVFVGFRRELLALIKIIIKFVA